MKKYLNLSFGFAIAALACGVFYREFTKFQGFSGKTVLALPHVHLFALGTLFFLILGLYADRLDLSSQKIFRAFLPLYLAGLPLMAAIFLLRGVLEVLGKELSAGASAAISGVAGISHTLITAALVLLFAALRRAAAAHAK